MCRAERSDKWTPDRRAEWGGDHDDGAAGREHCGQVRAGCGGLEQSIGQRDERAVDQPAQSKARQCHADRGENKWQQARTPACDDEQGDSPDIQVAQCARHQRSGERADAEGRPIGAEQSGISVQVMGNIDGQRDFDRAIQEEEQPGQDDNGVGGAAGSQIPPSGY